MTRAILVQILGTIGAGAAVAAIAVVFWMMFGVGKHTQSRDWNVVWSALAEHYKPHMVSFFVLWLVAAAALTTAQVLSKGLPPSV